MVDEVSGKVEFTTALGAFESAPKMHCFLVLIECTTGTELFIAPLTFCILIDHTNLIMSP